ncbi:MAG TPA: hypothetical protein VH143_26025 [Kofleriaceae bacterium]|jgi:hypothetical protein|nr:hypothetical protein [Kofleriaceae bacterium]
MRTAVVALIVVGCSFRPHQNGGVADDDGDGGPPGDTSLGSDAGVPPVCATPGTIQDDFTKSTLQPQWLPFMFAGGSMVGVANNNLVLTVGGGQGATAGVYSRHAVNLSRGVIEAEVTSLLGGSGETGLFAGPDIQHFAGMLVQGGALVTELIDGASKQTAIATFDASAMKYWQIHELGGTLAFEVSPDGTTFEPVGSALASPTWISDVFITLSAGGTAGSAQFTNVDTQQPSAPWCTVDELHDTFPAGDQQWNGALAITKGCAYTLSGDATIAITMAATCELGTSYAWDFTGHAMVVKWGAIAPTPSASFTPMIALQPDMGAVWGIYVTGTQVCGPMPNMNCVAYAFDPTGKDAYWQLAESAGMVKVSSSADGMTWSTVQMMADPFTPVVGEIELGAVTTGGPQSDTITFDAVN